VAVLVLHSSTLQVSLLAAVSGFGASLIALPLGSRIEFRRKRPVMVVADLVRFVALLSVPAAATAHVLSYAQLCVVGVVSTMGAIAFGAASGAHLKALVEPEKRLIANSRFETTFWVSQTAGPPLGGLLVGVFGATVTMAVDGASFLLSALGVRRIRRPEPSPPVSHAKKDLSGGWRYILGHRDLRQLFFNGMLFGGSIMMTSPLLAVLMLVRLKMPPVDYGLALGVPCLGGVLGSRLAPPLTRRFGQRRVLLVSGALRAPWMLLIPFAGRGPGGLALIVAAEMGLLVSAGIFNPSFATFRMQATDDAYMARVSSSWSISAKTVQPLFMVIGGLISLVLSVQATIAIAGLLCLGTVGLLPWGGLSGWGRPSGSGGLSGRGGLSGWGGLPAGAGEADRDRDGAADGDGERSGVGQLRDDLGHGGDEPVEPLAELGEDGVDRGAADAHHRLGLDLGAEMIDAADGRGQVRESGAR
jgi:predicted MFS family arabinose efflux permease